MKWWSSYRWRDCHRPAPATLTVQGVGHPASAGRCPWHHQPPEQTISVPGCFIQYTEVEHTTEFCTYFSYNVIIQLLYINDLWGAAFNVVVHYLQLRDCLTSLEGLTNDEGQYLAMFTTAMDPNGEFKGIVSQTQRCCGDRVEQPAQFEEVWTQLLTAIRENLEARFPDVDVLDAMQVIRGLRAVLPSIKL